MVNNDVRLTQLIGGVLGVGVKLSAAALAAGLALSMFAATATLAHLLLNVGLVVLMATPVARVVVSIGEYVREHDWLFALVATIVLAELVASVVAAMR
jgi:uncharacterized membrane protein